MTNNQPVTDGPLDPSRRAFITRVSLATVGLAAGLVGVPIVGFLLGPLLKKVPETWRAVGNVNDFTIGDTVDVVFLDASPLPWAGVAAKTAAWLRRTSETEFTAFAINCSHLGCPVNWLPDAKLFLCPCHGGAYNSDGSVAAGPPPRPLTQYPVRIRGGQVEIRTEPLPLT